MKKSRRKKTTTALIDNPLEGEQLLLDALYGHRPLKPAPVPSPVKKPKPEHYKIVSISLYREDIENLNEMVQELKRRGHYKANKSQVIRAALAQCDLDMIAKPK